jgi:hypothetical protein
MGCWSLGAYREVPGAVLDRQGLLLAQQVAKVIIGAAFGLARCVRCAAYSLVLALQNPAVAFVTFVVTI